jgi:hypothetical protein
LDRPIADTSQIVFESLARLHQHAQGFPLRLFAFFDPCLSASIRGKFLIFPISVISVNQWSDFGFPDSGDVGDHGDSRSPLPTSFSQGPTPHRAFVENKSQSAIQPNGHRPVEVPFLYFSAFQPGSISALFSRFCCSVGRGS